MLENSTVVILICYITRKEKDYKHSSPQGKLGLDLSWNWEVFYSAFRSERIRD